MLTKHLSPRVIHVSTVRVLIWPCRLLESILSACADNNARKSSLHDKNYRMNVLDEFDMRILTVLQREARTPVGELAAEVGLSPPACYRRIRALRESGAIKREVALVAPAVMGWPLTMIVLVSLERDNGQIVDELIRKLRAAQEVIDMWYVTGDHDFVLHVAAQNMANYDVFMRRTLRAEGHVRSYKTLVVLQQPQRAAPLPPPACSS
jgi:Lrp/AsnC family leucine-responsive transcriptional regulator